MHRTQKYVERKPSEMKVFLKTKELIDITFAYTENWPKIDRFTLKDRVRNIALSILELLAEANEVYIEHKLLGDLYKTIKAIEANKNNNKKSSIEETLFLENKLLLLKLTAATKLDEKLSLRRSLQNKAFAMINIMDYFIELAYKRKLINENKQERWAGVLEDVSNLLGAWVKSDKKRFDY